MLKKALTLAAVAILAVSFAATANDHSKSGGGEKTAVGTIAKLDAASKTITVSDAKGASWTVQWNDSTKILGGEMKEGAPVKVGYTEADGKISATWIRVGEAGK